MSARMAHEADGASRGLGEDIRRKELYAMVLSNDRTAVFPQIHSRMSSLHQQRIK